MQLNSPFIISSRLMAAVQCGDATISLGYSGRTSRDGRTIYQWYIDSPTIEESGQDLKSGCGGGSIRQGMESLLSFLSACGESWKYAGVDGENSDLFPQAVAEWAAQNSDELSMLSMEIEESETCCVE